MKKPTQKTMNVIYAMLIFTPVFVQAGNMWTTNGFENLSNYSATRTPIPSEQVSPDQTYMHDQTTSPATTSPGIYNPDPALRSDNIYGAPAPVESGTDYNLDTAPDMDR